MGSRDKGVRSAAAAQELGFKRASRLAPPGHRRQELAEFQEVMKPELIANQQVTFDREVHLRFGANTVPNVAEPRRTRSMSSYGEASGS